MYTFWDAFMDEMVKEKINLKLLEIRTVLKLFFCYVKRRDKYIDMLAKIHATEVGSNLNFEVRNNDIAKRCDLEYILHCVRESRILLTQNELKKVDGLLHSAQMSLEEHLANY